MPTSLGASRPGAQKDVLVPAKLIRMHGKNGELDAALRVFETCRKEKATGTLLYNSILDACVGCQEVGKAVAYFQQAKDESLADTVSHNILMKGHLMRGDLQAAEGVLDDLKKSGLGMTSASYNAFLSYRLQSGDSQGMWRIVEEMRTAAIPADVVTFSILLRSQRLTSHDLKRVVSMMDEKSDAMDEVLLASFMDACVRTGSLQLLVQKKEEYMARGSTVMLTAPTYGALIKAYGQMRDLDQVWRLWNEMLTNQVKPTPVTFGCVVEALVANGVANEAWKLVNQVWEDELSRHLVNTVSYSTILKGFTHSREPETVMALYDEMRERGIRPNTITFNTILNAFAQCAAMDRVPALLEDMRSVTPPVEPDLVTYSTLVKGFCHNGDLDRGLKIWTDMTANGKFAPDEVMYNSLLDGCAKEHRLDDALRLLDDMKQRGVSPSNYTLSMLVKVMGRCDRLGQAFSLIQDLSQEHGFKVNLQVYTCLIQACFRSNQLPKAIALHEQILAEGLCPDEKLYTSLVRGCLQGGAVDEAVRMLRCAYNLPHSGFSQPSHRSSPGLEARCLDELITKLGGERAPLAAELLSQVRACQSLATSSWSGRGSRAWHGAKHLPPSTHRRAAAREDWPAPVRGAAC